MTRCVPCQVPCPSTPCNTTCGCKKTCAPAPLQVTKNLISVSKVPNTSLIPAFQSLFGATVYPTPYGSAKFVYEIVLTNTGSYRLTNLSVFDSLLANVATGTIDTAASSIVVTQGATGLVPLSVADAITAKGQLLNVTESLINACSINRIVVTLVFVAPNADLYNLAELLNTITVEGTIEKSPATLCRPAVTCTFSPLLVSAQLWQCCGVDTYIVGPQFALP